MLNLVLLASPTEGIIVNTILSIFLICASIFLYFVSKKSLHKTKKENSRLKLIKYKIENKNRW